MWLRADRGISLGTTPLATGTTPPVLLLGGGRELAVGLRIEITTGGARGTARFRYSFDDGTTWVQSNVLTAASVALTPTGLTADFPAGTYATDNVYVGRVQQWNDLSGNGLHATQGTAANQPTYRAVAAGGFAAGVVFTTPRGFAHSLNLQAPATVAFVAKRNTIVANYQPVASFGGGAHGLFIYAKSSATDVWGMYATANIDAGADASVRIDVFRTCIIRVHALTNCELRTNGVNFLNTQPGALGYNGGAIIGEAGGTQNLEGELAELCAWNRVLSVAECRRLERYLKRRYGTP